MISWSVLQGDCRARLAEIPAESVQCAVTSPPYWALRDYGTDGQIGLEESPFGYVAQLVEVFRAVRRVLRPDGTLWVNLGDTYAQGGRGSVGNSSTLSGTRRCLHESRRAAHARGESYRRPPEGFKPKDLLGMPWRLAFALQDDGWWLRSDIVWHKPNPMPESVEDRPTRAHEYLFLLSRSERYFYDWRAIAEPLMHPLDSTASDVSRAFSRRREAAPKSRQGRVNLDGPVPTHRNRRTVWSISTQPIKEAHSAVFPEELVRPCILAGSRPGDTVLDPFNGAGTTGVVAVKQGRNYVGIELNPSYVEISERRIGAASPLLARRAAP